MSDSPSTSGVKRRIKVSYTCRECRSKRTKCDKKSPCLACKNRKSACEYDSERQIKPRRPNKDSLILRLSNQLDYYKKMCKQFVPKSEFRDFSSDLVDIDYALGSRTLKKHNTFMTNEEDTINDLIIHSTNNNDSGEMLSIKYLLNNDDHVKRVFFKTPDQNKQTTNKISNITPSSIYYNKLTPYQKYQFKDFSEKLLSDKAYSNESAQSEYYAKAFQFSQYDNRFDDLNIVEDYVIDKPTPLLIMIQEDIQDNLPSYTDLHFLINIYINNFYSEAPLFDITEIQTFIKENITKGKNDKIIIKPLETDIRNKVCYYSMIFIICGVSSISHKLKTYSKNENVLDFKYQMDNSKSIILSMQLIKCSKVYLDPNIIKLTAFMNIWLNFCYLPNPNFHSNVNDDIPTRLLTHSLLVLSDNINLYTLNHDNPNIGLFENDKEKNMKNYFILLFSIVVSIDDIYNQKCVTFKIDDNQRERLLQYSYKYNPLTNSESLTQTVNNNYNLYLVKLIMLYHIQDCYALITKITGSINLTQFEKRLNFMLEFYNRELSLNYMKTPNTKSIIFDTFTPNIKLDQTVAINKILFEISLIKTTSELKIYSLLLNKLEENKNIKYIDYFMKMINKIIDNLIMLNDFTNGSYQKYLGDLESIMMAKNCKRLFNQIIFCTLQLLSKFILNNHEFSEIITVLFKILYKCINLYTLKYRFIHYDAFKVCLFVENVIINYVNGEYSMFKGITNEVGQVLSNHKNEIEVAFRQKRLTDILNKDNLLELDLNYMNKLKSNINFSHLFTDDFLTK